MFRHLDVSVVCTDDDQVTVSEKEDQVNPHGPPHFEFLGNTKVYGTFVLSYQYAALSFMFLALGKKGQ